MIINADAMGTTLSVEGANLIGAAEHLPTPRRYCANKRIDLIPRIWPRSPEQGSVARSRRSRRAVARIATRRHQRRAAGGAAVSHLAAAA
jgi:hypothetical protein